MCGSKWDGEGEGREGVWYDASVGHRGIGKLHSRQGRTLRSLSLLPVDREAPGGKLAQVLAFVVERDTISRRGGR